MSYILVSMIETIHIIFPIIAPPAQPSEVSVSKMATTAHDCAYSDAEVVQDDAILTGNNIHVILWFSVK